MRLNNLRGFAEGEVAPKVRKNQIKEKLGETILIKAKHRRWSTREVMCNQ
jgi:hypothetical protein